MSEYGVEVTKSGDVWRCVEARHLTGAENTGRNHVFVDAVDGAPDGPDLRGMGFRVRYGWDGMGSEEAPQPMALDKAPGDGAGAHIPIMKGMVVWVEMDGESSDRVGGMHSGWPDEEGDKFTLKESLKPLAPFQDKT